MWFIGHFGFLTMLYSVLKVKKLDFLLGQGHTQLKKSELPDPTQGLVYEYMVTRLNEGKQKIYQRRTVTVKIFHFACYINSKIETLTIQTNSA